MEMKVLLAVLAHPDDETFGMGGTLAYYAEQGVEVHLVCATRGEVGEVEPGMLEGYQSIGELRENELRCAARHLGLAGVHFLDFRDSGMAGSPENHHPQALAAADLDAVAEKVVYYMRTLKPQVVVTFDPIGGYMHPDHIAIQRATVRAFHAAGKADLFPAQGAPWQPQKLYFHTFPRGFMRLSVRIMKLAGKDPRKFGKNGDIDLWQVSEARFPINARVDYRSVLEKKNKAVACHASQGGMRITKGPMDSLRKFFGISDPFMRAYPPANKHKERDLFEGIN